jgi:hypothetical protein
MSTPANQTSAQLSAEEEAIQRAINESIRIAEENLNRPGASISTAGGPNIRPLTAAEIAERKRNTEARAIERARLRAQEDALLAQALQASATNVSANANANANANAGANPNAALSTGAATAVQRAAIHASATSANTTPATMNATRVVTNPAAGGVAPHAASALLSGVSEEEQLMQQILLNSITASATPAPHAAPVRPATAAATRNASVNVNNTASRSPAPAIATTVIVPTPPNTLTVPAASNGSASALAVATAPVVPSTALRIQTEGLNTPTPRPVIAVSPAPSLPATPNVAVTLNSNVNSMAALSAGTSTAASTMAAGAEVQTLMTMLAPTPAPTPNVSGSSAQARVASVPGSVQPSLSVPATGIAPVLPGASLASALEAAAAASRVIANALPKASDATVASSLTPTIAPQFAAAKKMDAKEIEDKVSDLYGQLTMNGFSKKHSPLNTKGMLKPYVQKGICTFVALETAIRDMKKDTTIRQEFASCVAALAQKEREKLAKKAAVTPANTAASPHK